VIAPDESSAADASSDLYRDFENFNMIETVRSAPLTGIGFGKPFLRPIALPDISAFHPLHEYIPHNSLLWLWSKVTMLGFLAFLYLAVAGTAHGVRAALKIEGSVDSAVFGSLVAFIPMVLVLTYVDITFEPQTTLLFGACLALAGSLGRLIDEYLAEQEALEEDPTGLAADAR